MTRLLELQESARRKLKGQRVWCNECQAYKYCSQLFAYGKPSGGHARYRLTLNDCPHDVYGTTRDFQLLTPKHPDYDAIITQTSPFTK